jgi:hypothetical protein
MEFARGYLYTRGGAGQPDKPYPDLAGGSGQFNTTGGDILLLDYPVLPGNA